MHAPAPRLKADLAGGPSLLARSLHTMNLPFFSNPRASFCRLMNIFPYRC